MLQIGQRVSYDGDMRPAWVGTITQIFHDPPNAEPMYKIVFDDGSEGMTSEWVLRPLDEPEALLL